MSDRIIVWPDTRFATRCLVRPRSEAILQEQCVAIMTLMKENFFHCPNGGKRSKASGARLKRMGVRAGVPDLLIFRERSPVVNIAIELKVPSGRGRLSSQQTDWLCVLANCGFYAHVIDNMIDFCKAVGYSYEEI